MEGFEEGVWDKVGDSEGTADKEGFEEGAVDMLGESDGAWETVGFKEGVWDKVGDADGTTDTEGFVEGETDMLGESDGFSGITIGSTVTIGRFSKEKSWQSLSLKKLMLPLKLLKSIPWILIWWKLYIESKV